ncbi:MAG: serine/threonine-protein kinase [Candidatus Obscuribacterales bacterium]|jgi:serine/threonine protein kinase
MDIEIDPQAETVIVRGLGKTEHHYRRGDVIGESYQLIDLIGQGGMGVVYRVQHLILGKQYALKLLAPNQINSQNWRRFEQEGRSLARLNHANIVAIHNMGIDKGCPYFVMDWLAGISLADQIKSSGPLSKEENVDIYLQICAGLSCAHKSGIIHRDIKPGNIMLVPSATGLQVKIVDFGMARLQVASGANFQALTANGEIFGSPYYMSPEQTLGEEMDVRSDIYSLGCSLFETVTGRVPFAGPTAIQTLMMHQEATPPIPSITLASKNVSAKTSSDFDAVVARCLHKEPKHRYQSADQLAIDLQRIADGKPIGSAIAREQPSPQKAEEEISETKTISQSKVVIPLMVITTLVLLGVAIVALVVTFEPAKKSPIIKDSLHFAQSFDADSETLINQGVKKTEKLLKNVPVTELKDFESENKLPDVAIENQKEEDNAIVQLLKSTEKISKGVKVVDGKRMVCFKFPMISLGRIRTASTKHSEAKGELQLPANEEVNLHLNYWLAKYPALLDKFAPEDISTVRIESIDSSGAMIERLSHWTKLYSLTIEGGRLNGSNLGYFDKLTHLTDIWLKRLTFDSKAFGKLKLLSHISNLQIEDCPDLKMIIQSLPVMPALKTLYIEARGENWLDSKSIAALAKQPQLKTIYLKTKEADSDRFSLLNGTATTPSSEAEGLAIYDWRYDLAKLKRVKNIVFKKPNWQKEKIEEFLHLVPAAKDNAWTPEFGYKESLRLRY